MSACVIGIDVGTSGVRAAALDERGALMSTAAVAMTDFGDPVDPAVWWRCVRAALTDLGAACDLGHVRGLAVDGTSGTMLAVDRLGEPVGAPRMYDEPCDDEAVIRAVAAHAPAASAARGATSALARVLLMQDRPGALRLLHQADWIAGKLSGRFDRSDWNNALKTGYDPVADPMARVDRTRRRRCRQIACRSRAGRAHRPGEPRGRQPWPARIGDRACRDHGRVRLVPGDRRRSDRRRRDRPRIDAGGQASQRSAPLRARVWHLQPSDRLRLARGGRLEYGRQGDRTVLSPRPPRGVIRGPQTGRPDRAGLLPAAEARRTLSDQRPRAAAPPRAEARGRNNVLPGDAGRNRGRRGARLRENSRSSERPRRAPSGRSAAGRATPAGRRSGSASSAFPLNRPNSEHACVGVARLALKRLKEKG